MSNEEMLEILCEILRDNKLDKIANVIEQLTTKCSALESERDAAVAEIEKSCTNCRKSSFNNETGAACTEICGRYRENWEWRGVQDE